MKLLIRNLARSTTESELRKIFEALGPVQSCNLVTDKQTGKSKGFAFIEMPKPGDAKAAVKTLNGKDIAGNKIRVKKAVAKTSQKEKATELEAKPEKADGATTKTKVEGVAIQAETEKNTKKPVTQKSKLAKKTPVNKNIWSTSGKHS